jgi:hypothetical protein
MIRFIVFLVRLLLLTIFPLDSPQFLESDSNMCAKLMFPHVRVISVLDRHQALSFYFCKNPYQFCGTFCQFARGSQWLNLFQPQTHHGTVIHYPGGVIPGGRQAQTIPPYFYNSSMAICLKAALAMFSKYQESSLSKINRLLPKSFLEFNLYKLIAFITIYFN